MFAPIIIISILFFKNVSPSTLSVETNVGVIQGLASSDGSYAMYMGIPFALVNASNPFGAATKYPSFNEPFEAYDDSAICPQVSQTGIVGSVDCLNLNIYVPSAASSTNKLPVMVWIYGGAFMQGSASRAAFGADHLVRHDVILVTLNYRVGPYGFMCLNISEVPGNQGLKDQYMAMKWVKDNIEAFGGDVNNVALFGESAGGHSVEFHLRSLKENLFHKVIMESGSAVAATVFLEPDRQAPITLAAYLGYTTSDLHEALAFLASSDPQQVVLASTVLGMSFKPCVEKEFDGVGNFLTTTWVDTPVPKVANVPVLLGFNEHELMTAYLTRDAAFFKELDAFRNNLYQPFSFSEDELNEMEKIIRHFYIGDQEISKDVVWPIINYNSDFIYIHPIQRTLRKFIESGAGNVYYYMFSYSGDRNFAKKSANITEEGAAHADELGYLFDMAVLSDKPTVEDQLVLDRMTKMWTNFAKYSDPTPATDELLPVTWLPVTADTWHCMNINSDLTLIGRPLHERMAFWDLFYKMNKELQRTFDDF